MEFISKSEKETEDFASSLAKKAKAGDVLALFGDLGSGKTTFAKGFARALGVKSDVTSPTFVIMKKYPLNKSKFFLHVDCYRFQNEDDAKGVGLDEYFQNKNFIILLEWPERIEGILPRKAKKIFFRYLNENERQIITEESR